MSSKEHADASRKSRNLFISRQYIVIMKKIHFSIFMVLLLSGVVAAQDVGEILFRDILRMNAYPGPPFTGRIFDDLVMFFFVPSVFLIVVIFTLAGRLTDDTRIKVLLGITFFLLVVVQGLFVVFAMLAGPYFLFLLFFLGLFMFFVGHFGVRRASGGQRTAGFRSPDMETPDENRIRYFLRIGTLNPVDRTELEHELSIVNSSLERMDRLAVSGAKIDTGELHRLQKLKADVERKLYGRRLGK